MSLINTPVPAFKAQAYHNGKFEEVSDQSIKGKWSVFMFLPAAFTFNCPTEIEDSADNYAEFQKLNAEIYVVSTDTHFVHLAWRREHPDLEALPFPMLADTKRELSSALGILHKQDGVPLRATFIVDPDGVIRFASVNDLSVGRNVDEVLRVLDALQTDELCPCNWQKGEPTLQVAS